MGAKRLAITGNFGTPLASCSRTICAKKEEPFRVSRASYGSKHMPRWALSSFSLFFLLGAGAVLGASGSGCASASRHSGGPSEGRGEDGGVALDAAGTPAPAPLGVSIFAASCASGAPTVDWSPMRRISRVEYNNMVRDLLGDTSQPASGFPPESGLSNGVNFAANTYVYPSATALQDYIEAAETLAENALSGNQLNTVVLNGIASCGSAHDDTCAQDFIASWVNRAYRGQLDAAESSGLLGVYSAVKAQFDWNTGIQAVITAALESPRFLYVLEFGSGNATGNVVPLSQYEIAARLALFLWRSVPSVALMTAAASGQLSTPAQIQAAAQSMLAAQNPVDQNRLLAQDALDDFTNQWMQLTGVQAKDAQYADSPASLPFNANGSVVSAAMYDETRLDLSQLVLVDNGSLGNLLTSSTSYLNSDMQNFYYGSGAIGTTNPTTVNDPALGNKAFAKTPAPNRPGILTTGGVMATQAHSTLPSFVLRGKLVRENVLCDPIPAPPPGVPAPPTTAPDAGSTTRDLLLSHQQKGTACPACHQWMDTIGAGFGHFDATGWYQPSDANGFINPSGSPPTSAADFPAIDASGNITAGSGDTNALVTTFTDVNDLTTQLAGAAQVRQCFALQELRYALSRLERASDACSAQQVYDGFSSSQFNIQHLLLAIVGSDAFRYRSVETVGSSCQ